MTSAADYIRYAVREGNPHNYKGKVSLQRVHLNRDGYTSAGHYYGTGARLFYFFCEEKPSHLLSRDGFLRAPDRTTAKALVRAQPLMSECRFYN